MEGTTTIGTLVHSLVHGTTYQMLDAPGALMLAGERGIIEEPLEGD